LTNRFTTFSNRFTICTTLAMAWPRRIRCPKVWTESLVRSLSKVVRPLYYSKVLAINNDSRRVPNVRRVRRECRHTQSSCDSSELFVHCKEKLSRNLRSSYKSYSYFFSIPFYYYIFKNHFPNVFLPHEVYFQSFVYQILLKGKL